MTMRARSTSACLLALLSLTHFVRAEVIYVDADATGANDGTSWCAAFKFLQDAMLAAENGDEIHVAQGIYRPDRCADQVPGDRLASFELRNGVAVIGGFAGCDAEDPYARDPAEFETILSGDLTGNDNPVSFVEEIDDSSRFENSLHVVRASGVDNTTVLHGVTITGGRADEVWPSPEANGGGLHLESATPIIKECHITLNFARDFGGGCYAANGSSASFLDCSMFRNLAGNKGGGLLASNKCNLTVADGDFSQNLAQISGGGLHLSQECNAHVLDTRFFANRSGTNGGGAVTTFSSPLFERCYFLFNDCQGFGGGLSVAGHEAHTAIIRDCEFAGNEALQEAGGLHVDLRATIERCRFSSNESTAGGGLYNGVSATEIRACRFRKNHALEGGAIRAARSPQSDDDPCTIHIVDTEFEENTATHIGGAVSVRDDCDLIITRSAFKENHSGLLGGGLALQSGTDATVSRCSFFANRAESGGSVYLADNCGLNVDSSVFVASAATSGGGAIYNFFESDVALENCTLVGNVTAGSAGAVLNLTNSTLSVSNSIMRVSLPTAIESALGSTAFVEFSNIEGIPSTNGNIDVDPEFVADPSPGLDGVWGHGHDSVGDVRLLSESPCINAGDPTHAESLDLDHDSHARVLCGRVDMGAFEFGIGDPDCDLDVDLADFSIWQDCIGSLDDEWEPRGCEALDFNGDRDTDLHDFAGFQSAFGS